MKRLNGHSCLNNGINCCAGAANSAGELFGFDLTYCDTIVEDVMKNK